MMLDRQQWPSLEVLLRKTRAPCGECSGIGLGGSQCDLDQCKIARLPVEMVQAHQRATCCVHLSVAARSILPLSDFLWPGRVLLTSTNIALFLSRAQRS